MEIIWSTCKQMAQWQSKCTWKGWCSKEKTNEAYLLCLFQPLHDKVFVSYLRWRWRCLEYLPTSWQGVWWSDGLVQTFSSLGCLWTNENILVSLETGDMFLQWKLIRAQSSFHELVPQVSGAITSFYDIKPPYFCMFHRKDWFKNNCGLFFWPVWFQDWWGQRMPWQ